MPRTLAVLHQGRPDAADPTVRNAWSTQEDLVAAAAALGWLPRPVFLDDRFAWTGALLDLRPDLVFNAADLGFFYDIALEPTVAAVLDATRLPYTGSGPLAGAFSGDKYASKVYLRALGVPVPGCWRADALPADLPLPVILKARRGHNSVGITAASVFRDRVGLDARVSALGDAAGEWVVEAYIDGVEAAAGFLGNAPRRALPQFTITFGAHYADGPRILDYASKWEEDSPAYRDSTPEPAAYGTALRDRIDTLVDRVAAAFDIRDYGRCDLRIRDEAEGPVPYVIDVNTNPDVNRGAGLTRMARAAGLDHVGLVGAIVDAAVRRGRGAR